MPSASSRSPDLSAIQRVANAALQSKHVDVEELDGYLYRSFSLRTSPGFFYTLKCSPPYHVRRLRHEEQRLEVEAYALQTLKSMPDLVTARLIEYHNTKIKIGDFYLICGPFSGRILSEIEPSLSRQALASIDRSLGQYVRRLAAITGQSFGSMQQVQVGTGAHSWARAFAAMLESVLRDGEDALISLPYEGVRDLVRKHRGSLDRITQPRLVVLELASDKNVVVDVKNLRVTSPLDLSTAFWGDPFMSDCFYKPTASFAEGFGKLPNRDADERVRQYLYVLYHSLLAVVRHCYRPSEDGDELEARRDLTTAMRQLSSI